MTQPPKPTAPWPRRPARWPPHHGPVSEPRRGGGLWDSCEHVPFLLPGKSPSSSGLDAWPTPVTLLPSHSAAPRLPSPRAHPTAGTRSPVRRLTVQGVGQHARHTLHHHLVGGLQESRGGARSGLRLGLTLTGSDEHVTGTRLPRLPQGSVYLGGPRCPPPPTAHAGGPSCGSSPTGPTWQ